MWELAKPASRGGFSARGIITYAIATIIVAFLWVILIVPATHAADANWDSGSIHYNDHLYDSAGKAKAGASYNLPTDSVIYQYIDVSAGIARLIYFPPGTDPTTATSNTSAKYVEYNYTPPDSYSSPHAEKDISVDQPTSLSSDVRTCAVDGIGWIVCPVAVFLAHGMDIVFNLLSGFVEVRPATTNSDGPLYVAWNLMRSIANVAFIIAFLIIIYSQVTNLGISNYGIKKLLPRLIVTAILVNLSYYICSLAIDLSNILGYSFQDLMVNLRRSIFKIGDSTYSSDIYNWQSITGAVLAGGTAGVAIGVSGASTLLAAGGTVAGLIYILLPILVGLFAAILVVFLILAARQALVTILVIIAPLALVAYLLPNTEKWFGKWRELFTTMLVFFPAFSLVFGGAQLAAAVIIQNANSFNVIVLGMIVQVAPLVITPLLLRLSGGLISRIAGIVNNPSKGMVDRTRNWAKARAEMHKERGIGEPLKRRNFARRAARSMAYRQHRLERRTEAYKQGFQEFSTKRDVTDRVGQRYEVNAALSKLNTENYQADLKQAVEELRGGSSTGLERLSAQADLTVGDRIRNTGLNAADKVTFGKLDISPDAFAKKSLNSATQADRQSRIISQATHSAQEVQQHHFADALVKGVKDDSGKIIIRSEDLRRQAGGIDPNGATAALTSAIATTREAYGKSVSNAQQLIAHYNLSAQKRQQLALGEQDVEIRNDQGELVYTFKKDDIFSREAAIEQQMKVGTYAEQKQIIARSGNELKYYMKTIGDAVPANGVPNKAGFLGGQTIDNISQGEITSLDDVDATIIRWVTKGKPSQKGLAAMDADALQDLLRNVTDNNPNFKLISPQERAIYKDKVEKLSHIAQATMTGDERVNLTDKADSIMLKIAQLTDPKFVPKPIADPEEIQKNKAKTNMDPGNVS